LLRSRDRPGAGRADVVVYPSQDEIFGLVPLEAWAGTPVIVADDSVWRGHSGVGRQRIVPLGDVEALSAASSTR
jgi:glycosyltransferase involved in cell wall biosynthesis